MQSHHVPAVYTPLDRLRLSKGLHLCDRDWTFISVDPEEQCTWPKIEGEFIVIVDCKHTLQEIEVLPGTLVNNPGNLVLWLRCTHPPTYLPKGQIKLNKKISRTTTSSHAGFSIMFL
ncbi:hypothetical protein DUI87_05895 [Hirundo rustica rustica]|uniref:Uncharacterized protein n=1 Tax=Hirundo rustica rustica TaxID=333673 RepID=A0A3M0L0M0_HIRRU|nr:hypothetical protein DUI87_05895 [Hirundo rustica rustica]